MAWFKCSQTVTEPEVRLSGREYRQCAIGPNAVSVDIDDCRFCPYRRTLLRARKAERATRRAESELRALRRYRKD